MQPFRLKHLPNYITLGRIALTTSLIFLTPLEFWSILIFLLACVTDMVDGPLARNIEGAKSNLGAELDSLADLYLIIVSVFVIVPAMDIWEHYWLFILAALAFKLCNVVPGLIKHRKVFFLHTLGNKLLALFMMSVGIFYFIFGGGLAMDIYIAFVIAIVFLITLEEMLIISLLAYPNKNLRGIWQLKEVNARYHAGESESTD